MVNEIPPIVLTASGASLVISPDEHAWSQIHFAASGVRRPLGAERLKYIAEHIVSFLSDLTSGQRWVLSLSELHVSAYGEHLAGKAVLHLQDAEGMMFADLEITEAARKQWIDELSQYLSK
jgi:hypothetical protein